MVLPRGDGLDFYHKYRPHKFSEVSGHKQVISSIKKAISSKSRTRAFLLIGDSGTGKTTTARIMALRINCETPDGEEPCLECSHCKAILTRRCSDIIEINAADTRGIGDIRQVCKNLPLMPLQLNTKVLILDEAHQLTNDAQSSLLKELEEAPEHVTFILCSTHPQKILPTVKNRCQMFKFTSLRKSEMVSLLEMVASFEGHDLPKNIYGQIADSAGGSPRSGLVLLQQVIQMESTEQVDVNRLLEGEDSSDPSIIKVCFELDKAKPSWIKLMEIYDECKSLGVPAIGMTVAGFFRNKLIKSKDAATADRYSIILELFVDPFADGKLGENQLVMNLYRAYKQLTGGNNATPRYGRNSN